MIYSCTQFFNEFDMLNVKASEELAGGVDRFIAVESSRTHQNEEKPLWLSEDRDRITSPIDIVVVGEEFDRVIHEDPIIACFQREAIQRNAGVRDIDLDDNDVVICADVDEIYNAEDISKIEKAVRECKFVRLLQRMFCYKINLTCDFPWSGGFAALGGFVKAFTLNRLRTQDGFKVATRGKHFSHVMSAENISIKLKSGIHCDFNTPEYTDVEALEKNIRERKDIYGRDDFTMTPVIIDDTWPKMIRDNLDYWEPYIIPGATKTMAEVPIRPISRYMQSHEMYEEVNQGP